MTFLDLTGQRFGRLLVLSRAPSYKTSRAVRFLCLCDCGEHKTIISANLRRGTTRSCGCLARESASDRRRAASIPLDSAMALAFLRGYKGSAAHRHLPFELTDAEALELALQDCFYCGSPPSRSPRVHGRKASPQVGSLLLNGIDRVDNSQGYTVKNTVPCCSICNDGKKDRPLGVWLAYLTQLVAFRKGL